MKMYDVIIERQDDIYRAFVPALPNISAEGLSRDEAIINAKKAIEEYFTTADVVTIAVNVPATEFQQYSTASDWIRAAHMHPQVDDELYQSYLAELAADKQRQREEAEREGDLAEAAERP